MRKLFGIVITLLVVASGAVAQSLTAESFTKTKVVLDRSVAAYGGTDALNAISNVSLRIAGESVHRNQSRRPEDFDRTPYSAELLFDLKNSRARQVQKGHYPGGFNWHVEMTIPVHGPPTTIAEFRKAVLEMKVSAK